MTALNEVYQLLTKILGIPAFSLRKINQIFLSLSFSLCLFLLCVSLQILLGYILPRKYLNDLSFIPPIQL